MITSCMEKEVFILQYYSPVITQSDDQSFIFMFGLKVLKKVDFDKLSGLFTLEWIWQWITV